MSFETALRHGALVAVCDGAKGLIFENRGHAGAACLETLQTLSQKSPPTRLQGSAAPGRAIGAGGRHLAFEQTDLHSQMEESFLRSFAKALEKHSDERKAESLFLVAPPVALGQLREALGEKTRKRVHGELARDYTRMPLEEIQNHLDKLYEERT